MTAAAWMAFSLCLVVCATTAQPSPDLWWQLAGGRLMVAQHVFPWHDSFSFTAEGRLWLNHEWLAEALMAWTYENAGGLPALHAVRIVVLFAVFYTAARVPVLLGASEVAVALGACVALLGAEWRFFFDVRPYLFTYLGVALSMLLATHWLLRGRREALWALPVLFALWANLHAGVMAGLVLLTLMAAGGAPAQPRRAGALLVVVVISAAACILNPYGVHILVFPFEFLGKATVWSAGLNEWARTEILGDQRGFALYLSLSAICAVRCRKQLGGSLLLVLVGFAGLSLSAWRHIPLYAVVSLPAVGLCMDAACAALSCRLRMPSVMTRALPPVALALLGLATLWALATTDWRALSMESRLFPEEAVRFLRRNPLPERLYNPYGWGGYFAWTLAPRYRVFMDGRANTLYPPEVYRDFLRIAAASPSGRTGERDWDALLEQYGVQIVVLNRWEQNRPGDGALSRALAGSTGWGRLYQDDLTEIYLRKNVDTATIWRSNAAGRLWFPGGARLAQARALLENGRLDDAADVLLRLLAENEEAAQANAMLALVEVRRGHPNEAEQRLRQAIALDPRLPDAHFNLAALLWARGDRQAALEAMEEEVRVNPDAPLARQRLEQMRQP